MDLLCILLQLLLRFMRKSRQFYASFIYCILLYYVAYLLRLILQFLIIIYLIVICNNIFKKM